MLRPLFVLLVSWGLLSWGVLASGPDLIVATLLIFTIGMICWWTLLGRRLLIFTRDDHQAIERRILHIAILIIAATFSIFVLSVVAVRVFSWATWDPIGASSDDGWGSLFPLIHRTIYSIPNGTGDIAVIRRDTAPFVGDMATYYVFVHEVAKTESRQNLLFRYESTPQAALSPPQVIWKKASVLLISVPNGSIYQVTKQMSSAGKIAVRYNLGKPVLPTTLVWWQRPLL